MRQEKIEEITKDIVILLNMSGTLFLTTNVGEYEMKKGDIVLINSLTQFSCIPNNSIYVLFYVNREKAQECFDDKRYIFECNSTKEVNYHYDRLRKILSDIMVVSYLNNQYYYIKMNQLFYELIVLLLTNFSIELMSDELDRRKELIEYMEINYQKELSLQEVADSFHMSKHYFSKYFKKHVEVGFYQFLTDIRLKHALYDVEKTEKKMLQVAMDNGFSNLSSFNHYFKDKYGMNPKDYRMECLPKKDNISFKEDLKYIIDQMNVEETENENVITAYMDSNSSKQIIPFWKELLNFGNLKYLDDHRIVSHLQSIQQEIGYLYLRIQFEDSAYKSRIHSFSQEERWFDQIMDMNLIPWIVIDYRHIKDLDIICEYLEILLSHFANRYSIHSIQKWRVECVYNTIFDDKKMESYLSCYNRIQTILDKYKIHQTLMAAGLSLGNREGIRTFFEYLEEHNIVIENQTFQVEPYVYYKNEEGILLSKPNEDIDIHQDLMHIKKFNPYYEKYVKNAYIVRWRNDVSPTNILNDSCRKGASIVKQIIKCLGLIQGLSGDIPLDAMYDPEIQKGVLFGGDGMISYQGIHKPSFYAFSLMAKGMENYIYKNENAIFLKNNFGNYHVICHNCKALGPKYYMERSYMTYANMDEYLENTAPLSIKVRIDNVQNGTYIIKKRTISTNGGSVQDELNKMLDSSTTYIHPHDIQFIESITIPQITLKTVIVNNGIFETTIDLIDNEFAYLHIIHQY